MSRTRHAHGGTTRHAGRTHAQSAAPAGPGRDQEPRGPRGKTAHPWSMVYSLVALGLYFVSRIASEQSIGRGLDLERPVEDSDAPSSLLASARPSMRYIVVLSSRNFCMIDAIPWLATANMRRHWHVRRGRRIHPAHLLPTLLGRFLSHPSLLCFAVINLRPRLVIPCCTLRVSQTRIHCHQATTDVQVSLVKKA